MKGFADLLKPISIKNPCGNDLRYDPVYDEIKLSKIEDDPNLPQGIWQTDIKKADWDKVENLCQEVLLNKSKDIIIISWLGEAWASKYGLEGVESGLSLLYQSLEGYWNDIYPLITENDAERRIAALSVFFSYIDKRVQYVPLIKIDDGKFPYTLYDWKNTGFNLKSKDAEHKNRRDLIKKSIISTKTDQLNCSLSLTENVITLISKTDKLITDKLGPVDAGLSALRSSINNISDLIKKSLDSKNNESNDVKNNNLQDEKTASTDDGFSLEKAYQALSYIEKYIQSNSPQSPAPALIHLAVALGQNTFEKLLDIGSPEHGFALTQIVNLCNSVKFHEAQANTQEIDKSKIEEILLKK